MYGVKSSSRPSVVGTCRSIDLHGSELFDGAAWCQAGRQGVQAPAERNMQTVGERGDEDMRLDTRLVLVKDRADGEIALKVAERLLDADALEVEAP